MAIFTDDLEFYDDGGDGGPEDYTKVKEDFVGVFKNVPALTRELLSGTLESIR